MGISYKNSSGYPDPTAYMAVHNMEAEEKMLHIQYPTGYIDLRLEAFFPCTLDRARKIFRLVCQYCSQGDKDRLLRFLQEKERRYQAQVRTFTLQSDAAEKPAEKKAAESRMRESARLQARTRRNIELFLQMEGKAR